MAQASTTYVRRRQSQQQHVNQLSVDEKMNQNTLTTMSRKNNGKHTRQNKYSRVLKNETDLSWVYKVLWLTIARFVLCCLGRFWFGSFSLSHSLFRIYALFACSCHFFFVFNEVNVSSVQTNFQPKRCNSDTFCLSHMNISPDFKVLLHMAVWK